MKPARTALAAAAIGALALTAIPASAAPAAKAKDCGNNNTRGGLEAVALTSDNALLCLKVNNPGAAKSIGKVSGLSDGDTKLIGIDYRPENGKLYGIGDAGGIYTVSSKNAQATRVASMSEDLKGSSFGVDFNSTVDRLRIVSDAGQNLRVNVADGATTVDGALTRPIPGAVAPAPLTEDAVGITGAAYTNNDKLAKTATATTLFDLDTDKDRIVIQSPANGGATAPTGNLGRDAKAASGFDIYSFLRGGESTRNVAYAALSNGDRSTLFVVDLLDGSLKNVGKFAAGRGEIVGLALPLNQG
ncbi:MAG: DUF4394 domain-containing protein [Sporichthyaceae bacterium]